MSRRAERKVGFFEGFWLLGRYILGRLRRAPWDELVMDPRVLEARRGQELAAQTRSIAQGEPPRSPRTEQPEQGRGDERDR